MSVQKCQNCDHVVSKIPDRRVDGCHLPDEALVLANLKNTTNFSQKIAHFLLLSITVTAHYVRSAVCFTALDIQQDRTCCRSRDALTESSRTVDSYTSLGG